jgi:hypothetical protein
MSPLLRSAGSNCNTILSDAGTTFVFLKLLMLNATTTNRNGPNPSEQKGRAEISRNKKGVRRVTGPGDSDFAFLQLFLRYLGHFTNGAAGEGSTNPPWLRRLARKAVPLTRPKTRKRNDLQETAEPGRIAASLVHYGQRRHPESGVAS